MKNEHMMKRYIKEFYAGTTSETFMDYWQNRDDFGFHMARHAELIKESISKQQTQNTGVRHVLYGGTWGTMAPGTYHTPVVLGHDHGVVTTAAPVMTVTEVDRTITVRAEETRLERRRGLLQTTMNHFNNMFTPSTQTTDNKAMALVRKVLRR